MTEGCRVEYEAIWVDSSIDSLIEVVLEAEGTICSPFFISSSLLVV